MDSSDNLIRVALMLHPDVVRRLDDLRRREVVIPSRGLLVRRLLERALDEVERQGTQKTPTRPAKAE
jgi:hypothetical protein